MSKAIDGIEDALSVLDNDYYSARTTDFKLGIMVERLEILLNTLRDIEMRKEHKRRLREEATDDASTSNN